MTRDRVRVLVLVALLLVLPGTAVAQDSADEAREQAEQLADEAQQARERAAQLAEETDQVRARVDQILATVGEVEARLATARADMDRIEGRLAQASAALEAAELRAEQAEARAERARTMAERAAADLDDSLAQLQANDDQRASVVRHAYMYGPGVSTPSMAALHMAEGTSPTDIADVLHMLDVLLVDHGALVDESVRLAEESRDLAARAQRARDRRAAEAAAASAARDDAAARHADVLVLMGEAEQAVAAEQQAIAELQDQKARAERQVARLQRARAAAEGDAASKDEQAQQASDLAEELAAEAAAAAAAAATPAAPAGITVTPVSGGLTSVGGITVATSLAPQLEALLAAARADGIVLGGYGYRSVETTIRLRRANGCPDVWTSPPSSCRVPTARPGTSMHERGLAVDFTWQGRTICYPNPPSRCHGNAAHDWLRANAASYGLHGLSSEAWHFSTNGR